MATAAISLVKVRYGPLSDVRGPTVFEGFISMIHRKKKAEKRTIRLPVNLQLRLSSFSHSIRKSKTM